MEDGTRWFSSNDLSKPSFAKFTFLHFCRKTQKYKQLFLRWQCTKRRVGGCDVIGHICEVESIFVSLSIEHHQQKVTLPPASLAQDLKRLPENHPPDVKQN